LTQQTTTFAILQIMEQHGSTLIFQKDHTKLRILTITYKELMKDNGHYDTTNNAYYISIEPNNNTLKSVVNIEAPYKVDFTTANSIRTVLGFNSQIYSSGYNESENIVNILSISSLESYK
jgi:hypothetical protein